MKMEKAEHWITSDRQRVYRTATLHSPDVLVVVKRKGRKKVGKVAKAKAHKVRVALMGRV